MEPPAAAAILTAAITLSVLSPSRPDTTGCAAPRITAQKLRICDPSGSLASKGSRSETIGSPQRGEVLGVGHGNRDGRQRRAVLLENMLEATPADLPGAENGQPDRIRRFGRLVIFSGRSRRRCVAGQAYTLASRTQRSRLRPGRIQRSDGGIPRACARSRYAPPGLALRMY